MSRVIVVLALVLMASRGYGEWDKKFVAVHGAGYAVGMTDTSLTAWRQGCCGYVEANPLAPQNPTLRALEVSASWAVLTWFDGKMRKKGKKWWWVPAAGAMAGHAYGIGAALK